jgi:adenosine deaminase
LSSADNLAHLVRLLPKVELHIHLEGTVRPETLLELARRRRVSLPADDVDGVREWFQFEDFQHFVEIYLTCCKCLRDPEDFQLVAEQFLTEQARHNVLYTEAHFTIGTHLANGANGLEVAEALHETICDAERKHGIKARLIPDIVRNVGVERADETLEWALECRNLGVVGLGLSGFEETPNDDFREHFQVASKEGLRRVAHAGEHQGPETIRAALDLCDAERIGHGIRALEDPGLMERLRDDQVPLEVCPSSNVCLHAVRDLGSHPFDELDRAGLQVTINSDDPPFFDTTLSDEYLRLARTFGYDIEKLAQLSCRALRFAFVDAENRDWLQREYDQRFEELGIHLEAFEVNANDSSR